ncbi:peptide deformylase [Candidatus Gracilibacteria bacterium]|nr:peptide deformylase [Candidatus Gracilibacteria bacterium]
MLTIQTGKANEILRHVAKKIDPKDYNKVLKLGKEMLKYIKDPEHGGVGLAAPQVGHSIRMVVVSLLRDREDENFKTVIMINPEILEHSQETYKESEGCLSVPGEEGEVERYTKIKLKYVDDKKREKIIMLENTSARIIQHEIDHLDGILFTDYVDGKKIRDTFM